MGARSAREPVAGEFVQMFAVSVLLRIAVFLTMTVVLKMSVRDFAEWADGKSYLWMAQSFAGSPPPYLREYDHRVFPGFSMILAPFFLIGLPLQWVGLAISWISSGLAAVWAAKVFDDRRIGWGMAVLTPQYVMNGSMVMTESLMMALTLGGLLLARNKRHVLGGVVAGVGGLVRPMVCFSVLGQMALDARAGRWRKALTYGVSAAVMLGVALAFLQWRTGDALQGPRVYATHKWAYGGQMFDWPMHSLLFTARNEDIPLEKLAYILLHLPIVFFACGRIVSQYLHDKGKSDPFFALNAPWLLGNTLFVVCVGSHWALLQFARFILVALPPTLYVFRSWLPKRPAGWLIWAIVSYFLAVITFVNI